jgi:hypothetical protein
MPDDCWHPCKIKGADRKDTASWSPLQLTPEEFARNVQGAR